MLLFIDRLLDSDDIYLMIRSIYYSFYEYCTLYTLICYYHALGYLYECM